MLYYFGSFLQNLFGPARLLQSYFVLIVIALYLGFILTKIIVPYFYEKLPHDRGREFAAESEAAKGKPTGAGIVFISIFVFTALLCTPLSFAQGATLSLVWFTMLTGFLDDKSKTSWGEYRKAFLDLCLSLAEAFLLLWNTTSLNGGRLFFWLPFFAKPVFVHPAVYIAAATAMLWTSINTTNCTDGIDGLSSVLVLIALLTFGGIFYFVLGHAGIAEYLLVPHLADGSKWSVIVFSLIGTLLGYLWHNAYPSEVLMGDAGSRAIGFFLGSCVMISGNPFLIFATSTIMLINGGMGLLKVALLRFCRIRIFSNVRFPLHDEMRKKYGWSPTQVLIKFFIMQILCTIALLGIFFKVR